MAQIENYSTEQRNYINMMEKDIDKARQLSKSAGFVVAGWGGDTYYCSISDLQTIEKAISDNSFIVCVDKENYDIK